MKYFFLTIIILFLQACGGPKTVLVCGDHVCVNKKEANQYFEENLSLEVKIIDNKKDKDIDLIELNLNKEIDDKKVVTFKRKEKTNKKIKTLSKKEIEIIKSKIKKKDKIKKIVKKNHENRKEKIISTETNKPIKNLKVITNVNRVNKNVVDVCTIIKKCSIDEISKYLLKEGKKKRFPEIANRK